MSYILWSLKIQVQGVLYYHITKEYNNQKDNQLFGPHLLSENTREGAVCWNAGPITCLIFVDVCHIIIRILQKFGARKAQHAVWRDSNVLQRRQASFQQNKIFYSMGNRKTSVHAFQKM